MSEKAWFPRSRVYKFYDILGVMTSFWDAFRHSSSAHVVQKLALRMEVPSRTDPQKKKERGGSLNRRQYDMVVTFLRTRTKPTLEELVEADLITTKRRYSRYYKLQSLAKRMVVTPDGNLILVANGKRIVPKEEFISVIRSVHEGPKPGDKHLMFSATLALLQQTYAIGRRQFGIGEELVRQVVQSCKKGSCVKKWKKLKQRAVQKKDTSYSTEYPKTTIGQEPAPAIPSVATELVPTISAHPQRVETQCSYIYQPCPNHSSVYQLVSTSAANIPAVVNIGEQHNMVAAACQIVSGLPALTGHIIPSMLVNNAPALEHREDQSATGTAECMPVLKSYLVSSFTGNSSFVGSNQSVQGSILTAATTTGVTQQTPFLYVLPYSDVVNNCATVIPPVQSTASLGNVSSNSTHLNVQKASSLTNLEAMLVQCPGTTVKTQPEGKNEKTSSNPLALGQSEGGFLIIQGHPNDAMETDSCNGDDEIVVIDSDMENDDTERSRLPTPFPHIWHYYTDVNEASDPYQRLLRVIQDARLDMLRSFVDTKTPVDRMKKKLEFLEKLLHQQKDFTSNFLVDDESP